MSLWMRKIGIALALLSTVSLLPMAQAAQGIYSTKALIGANVYTMKGKKQKVGEVDNVMLDEGMHVTGLVVSTDSLLGMGGKKLYVKAGQFSVMTENASKMNDVTYKVYVDATKRGMKNYPVVGQGWWNETKKAAVEAWKKTKSGVHSAWESTKEVTSNAYDATKNAASDVTHSVKDKMQQ